MVSTLLPLSRGAVGGVPTTGSGTAAMGGGDLGVWSERGEFGVCREWGELGVSAVWGSGDGGNRLDSMGEVLEAPPFADFMSDEPSRTWPVQFALRNPSLTLHQTNQATKVRADINTEIWSTEYQLYY